MTKVISQGFIDGYNYSDYNHFSGVNFKNYFEDYHDGRRKRNIHESILCERQLSAEDFEENNNKAIRFMQEW